MIDTIATVLYNISSKINGSHLCYQIKIGDEWNNMGTVYGYCRISRKTQNIERQERNILKAYPDAQLIREVFTGTKFYGRTEFQKLLKKVQPDDTIVFDEVSRMARNADEGFQLYKELFEKRVNLVFLKEKHINTATFKETIKPQLKSVNTDSKETDGLLNSIISAINTYILNLAEQQIYIAFEYAEKEVKYLHNRTKEGIETARLNGKQIGTPKGASWQTKKSISAKKIIRKHSKSFGGNLKDDECIKLCNISRKTYYKYKKEIAEELLNETAM